MKFKDIKQILSHLMLLPILFFFLIPYIIKILKKHAYKNV